jgi:predicted nucleotidyltransferase component of viral defense system
MANIDYIRFYKLQDQVMNFIFSNQDIFYLTGGTCLSRFYQEKRFSDDLDFFTHENDKFSKVLREIKAVLKQKFEIIEDVTSKDFVRFIVDKVLQVDFVNDRVMRYKDIILRLKTFPVKLLKYITLVDDQFLDGFEKGYSKIIEKIEIIINKN